MSTRIISVVHSKGGVSKTSTGLFLATALAVNKGYRVLYIDADSQASAYEYRSFESRMEEYKDTPPPYRITTEDPNYLLDELSNYVKEGAYDIIFLDLPRFTLGKQDTMLVACLVACDSLLIPIKSGELDTLSTIKFVEKVKEIEKRKKERGRLYKYAGFLSMTGKRPTDDRDARQFAEGLSIHMMEHELQNLREFTRPYTYESLLDIGPAEKKRFAPFFKEVLDFFEL